MSDGPEWFAPKRHGYGVGKPISWQGWALTIAFAAIVITIALKFVDRPIALVAALVPFLVTYLVIGAKTTRGGWHWRWGEDD